LDHFVQFSDSSHLPRHPAHLRAKDDDGDTMIPDNEDALLRRRAVAEALTEAGYPTAPGTLATKATRGGGPPFRLYGRIPLYRWGDALSWARSRLSRPVSSTAEFDPRPSASAEAAA